MFSSRADLTVLSQSSVSWNDKAIQKVSRQKDPPPLTPHRPQPVAALQKVLTYGCVGEIRVMCKVSADL